MNPYDIMGLPMQFHLSPAELRKRFMELSQALHPDRQAGNSLLNEEATQRMAQLTQAYRLLQDREQRLVWWMEHHGLQSDTDRGRGLTPAFYLSMLELNDAVEMLEENPDPDARKQLTAQIMGQLEDNTRQLDERMAESDRQTGTPLQMQTLEQARDLYQVRRYFLRLEQRLRSFDA